MKIKNLKLLLGDFRYWLLFFIINMSGNLCFNYFFPDRVTIIALTLIVTFYFIIKRGFNHIHILFTCCFVCILALQAFFLNNYSLQSSIHFLLKIYTGISVVIIIGNHFIDYYKKILLFFCVVSLFCFTLNCLGVVLPFINITSTNIDGGRVLRVSSVLYTQLYSIGHSLTLRNCGPFWEPGAFQGFINLALFFEILSLREKNKLFSINSFVYIITILTTTSTGGYVTLFVNIGFLIIKSTRMQALTKFIFLFITIVVCAYLFFNIEFLGEKIANDSSNGTGRLSFNFSNVDFFKLLIGSGLDPKSFLNSSLISTGSLLMLVNYIGVLGALAYFGILFRYITNESLFFTIIICLILMNEPFLTAGPFWWGVPFVWSYYVIDVRSHR